ncbi:protein S-acyltransferase [Malassezia psittaci]|uniref:Protein S-acyltransferase n=1 Tax=Malassezia psittaci TaxID=1821823 RepID=A0AAF0JEM7_9BASI|nr:protein S-acyltransferase [Malassezia psittaci]
MVVLSRPGYITDLIAEQQPQNVQKTTYPSNLTSVDPGADANEANETHFRSYAPNRNVPQSTQLPSTSQENCDLNKVELPPFQRAPTPDRDVSALPATNISTMIPTLGSTQYPASDAPKDMNSSHDPLSNPTQAEKLPKLSEAPVADAHNVPPHHSVLTEKMPEPRRTPQNPPLYEASHVSYAWITIAPGLANVLVRRITASTAINTERKFEGVLLQRYYSKQGQGTTLGRGVIGIWRRFRARHRLLNEWNTQWGYPSTMGNPWWIRNKTELAYGSESPAALQRAMQLEHNLNLDHSEVHSRIQPAPSHTTWSTSALINMELSIGPPITWALPIHKADSTLGVHFPLSPRYSDQGMWLPRSQWPELAL